MSIFDSTFFCKREKDPIFSNIYNELHKFAEHIYNGWATLRCKRKLDI
jgi:hypothetical protein